MSTISRYWDKYKERHRGESAEKSDLSKLANDKQAYISFLEVQLERVTQTVLTTQGFSDRIESLQTQLNSSDEKIINLTRLVKLQQTFAETQEDEINSIKKIFGAENKNFHITSPPSNIEKRLRIVEEKLESPKSERNRFEDFVKEIDTALKSTENRITALVAQVTDEIEAKQLRFQKDIEETLEKYSQQFEENYEQLSKKVYGRETESKKPFKKISELEKDSDRSFSEKTNNLENSVKDLEQFLVAIAEEVKKIDERQKETAELEYKVSSKLNQKVKKLSDLVHKSLKLKQDSIKSSKTPETRQIIQNHLKHENYSKESPKFPEVSSSHLHDDSRSRSKESNTSKERSKSPQDRSKAEAKSTRSEASELKEVKPRREKSKISRVSKASKLTKEKKSPKSSKSPKSATSRSRKSNSSSRTPISNSSSRTPKSRRSVSPNRTPGRSRAMEGCIREKIQKMKQKDLEERKIQMKKDEKRKTKKTVEKMSKLDKLYRDL
jgi:hypothetical protein